MEWATAYITECDAPLSNLYRRYITGDLAKKKFEGMIFQHLLGSHDKFRLFNKNPDRWNDFLSWLYPRIARAVELYRDLGSSFDAYITRLVNRAAKEYRFRETDHNITEHIWWKTKAEENILFENEPEYLEPRKDVFIPEDIKPRQILFLLLKSYFFVSEDFVKQVTTAIGVNTAAVQSIIDELKKRRSCKELEILDLRERLYCQHYRCLNYQKRMLCSQPGTIYREKMMLRFERAKKRYHSMKKRLKGMRMTASNRMIAEILGIPRGTVDSNLHAIKNRFGVKKTKNSGF